MASKAAYKRLMKEYQMIQDSPPPFIIAKPSEKNILEWHYVISGPPDSPYSGGEYHGKLVFPSDYPFKPPAIQIITPNGRFKTNTRLCLSMSDFHPETWNPSWSVASILTGLLSFMLEEQSTLGSITTTVTERQTLARQSYKWNRDSNPKFKEIFPEIYNNPPPELPSPSLNKSLPPSSPTTSDQDVTGKDDGKGKDEGDNDLILTELKLLMQSGVFRMFVGGLIVYLVANYGLKIFSS